MVAIFLSAHPRGGKLECWGNVLLLCPRLQVGYKSEKFFISQLPDLSTEKLMDSKNPAGHQDIFQGKTTYLITY